MLPRVLWYCYEVSRNQWLRLDELKGLQEKRLKAIIRHAYENVPLYHEKFDSVGLKPDDIKSIESLTKIPFTEKGEVRSGIPDGSIAKGYNLNECVRGSTSGTSGGPMPVFYDKRFWDHSIASRYLRREMMMGLAPWERKVVIEYHRPETSPTDGNGERIDDRRNKSRGRKALGPSISIFKRWLKKVYIAYNADEIIQDIVQYQPKSICGNTSYLRLLAEAIVEKDIQDIHPRCVFSQGEVLDEPTRKFLESSFGCDVFNGYGTNEFCGIALECSKKEGLHVISDFIVLEIIRDGEPVGPGERGEIVITGLLNYAMPMIRYRVGDIGILSDESCSCGRGFPILKSVEGRIVDCFTLPSGRVVAPKVIQTAVQGTTGVSRYQVVQQDRNKVTVELMRKESDPEVSINELVTRLRGVLGDDVEIEVFAGDRKDLKAKFRPVISMLTVSGETRWTKPRRTSADMTKGS